MSSAQAGAVMGDHQRGHPELVAAGVAVASLAAVAAWALNRD
jgi:hypothetical protein